MTHSPVIFPNTDHLMLNKTQTQQMMVVWTIIYDSFRTGREGERDGEGGREGGRLNFVL